MSNDLKGLVAVQVELGRLISRVLVNVKKLGKEKVSIELLQIKLTKLDEYWKDFIARHCKIVSQTGGRGEDYNLDFFDAVEEDFEQQSVAIKAWISSMRQNSPADSAPPNPEDSGLRVDTSLPKIHLPSYAGDLMHWESFRDQFRTLVHDVVHLPKVRKLQYLKSCLTGEAAQMLARTPVTESNYDGAWASLERRFGNPRILSTVHMRRLINCPSITRPSPSEYKRLIDDFRQTLKSFQALGKPVAEWDEWFVFLMTEKLDEATRLAWETNLPDPTVMPDFETLEAFLENRAHSLASMRSMEPVKASRSEGPSGRGGASTARRHLLAVKVEESNQRGKNSRHCPLCSGNHTLGSCKRYQELSAAQRRDLVINKGLCLSCLTSGHRLAQCPSAFRCWACGQQHHTTIHDAFAVKESLKESSSTSNIHTVGTHQGMLLATATVKLEAPGGRTLQVRALLDTGSESSFLSEWAAQSLQLRKRAVQVSLTGYQGANVGTARSEVQVCLRSPIDNEFKMDLAALVTRTLVAPTPSKPAGSPVWTHIQGLPLADADFAQPARVDVLLGADVCGLLLQERKVGPPGTPVAVRTPFGWTLMGPVGDEHPSTRRARIHHVTVRDDPPDLQRFWELEEVPSARPLSAEEQQCETLFRDTTYRNPSGRYVVRLPFRGEERPSTGKSRVAAFRMLLNAETRRTTDQQMRSQYVDFMREYHLLGHITAARAPLQEQDPGSYIPHHAVWKEHEGKRKIRVVFNASAASLAGRSLNDALLAGPKLQHDLWAIITRWRLFRVAFSTDIVKMFRQILVHPEDQDWLRIVWRDDPSHAIQDFRMTTVTYGTAPAPYLAHRVLRQLASDEELRYPKGARALRNHSYVDDILAGADDLREAWEIRRQLSDILESAGFRLDKWASTKTELRSTSVDLKTFQDTDIHGALGLQWDQRRDTLAVRGSQWATSRTGPVQTKRTILSEIARLFDPLGWLAPVLIRAKILMQDLWLAGVAWDENIEPSIGHRWTEFRGDLRQLGKIEVPRWTHYSPDNCQAELHGFCDASERAYAAAVYLTVRRGSETKTSLLLAKSRVSPIKTQSIPRLELCGAVLLARLLSCLREALEFEKVPVYCWTDSTVALYWIRSHPSRWKPFVAHRVSELQSILPGASWKQVNTLENPADLATRGISADDLRSSEIWWNGPHWLRLPSSDWPTGTLVPLSTGLPEDRHVSVAGVQIPEPEDTYSARFSSLPRLVRVTAYVRRFASNCRTRTDRTTGPLTTSELRAALWAAVRTEQETYFRAELDTLRHGNTVSKTSSLKALTPFIDGEGTLRVGGRLQLSGLPTQRCHPALLDRTSHLATLVSRDAHLKTLHGGVNLTMSWVHRAFWIPRFRPRVKKILHDCVTCARMRASAGQQQMGNLPGPRIRPSKPFTHTGVDYAGPIPLRTARGRGHKSYKGYVVVFVCFATRAVHLDAVSDLTSSAFLAAFHRFTARRGHCQYLYSDNGTTFKGADSTMRQMFSAASQFYTSVAEQLASTGTEWTFIPPYSPHMGGLWEAAVKSMKTHLKRVIGEATLTYEEMATLLSRVEACLNSRPLTPLSEDPRDCDPLTPGHFLVGGPVISPLDDPTCDVDSNLTTRWRQISNMVDHFWRRWSREYLNTLQQRTRWLTPQANLRVGALVLVRDDATPPTRWPLARVEEVIPGQDGLVRVVKLRAGSRTFCRAVAKLVALPVHQTTDASGPQ